MYTGVEPSSSAITVRAIQRIKFPRNKQSANFPTVCTLIWSLCLWSSGPSIEGPSRVPLGSLDLSCIAYNGVGCLGGSARGW